MHNEREDLIQDLLARRDADKPPLPGWPMPQPGCPDINDLTAVALCQAAPALQERIERHLPDCLYCRTTVEGLRNIMSEEEVPELPRPGSLLDRAARDLGVLPKPRPTPPPLVEDTTGTGGIPASLGFTRMAKNSRNWPDLLTKLKRWLPYLMRKAELPGRLAEPLLGYIEAHLPALGDRRFTLALGDWFAEFAQAQGVEKPLAWLPSALTTADLDAWSLEMQSNEAAADDSKTMQRLKRAVILALADSPCGGRTLTTSDDLLTFVPPGCADDPDFEEDRSRLFFAAQREYGEATVLFEAAAA